MKNLFLLTTLILLLACNKDGKNEPGNEIKAKTQSASITADFKLDEIVVGGSNLKTKITAIVNGESFLIKELQGEFAIIARPDYAAFDIPSTAIAACHGIWDNIRTIYIVEKENDKLIIKEAAVNQESDEYKVEFKEIKTVKP
jgi:hypothetical protein